MTLLAQLSQELEELVARTAPSVVGVEHRRGHGSGVVLAGDGYVLTNAHVIGDAGRLRVRLSGGEEAAAERVGSDPRTDLAVLRVATAPLPSLPLATGRLTVGQLVVAIGNPLRFERSVSLGVVSAVDRSLPGREGPYEGLIQTDAAVNRATPAARWSTPPAPWSASTPPSSPMPRGWASRSPPRPWAG